MALLKGMGVVVVQGAEIQPQHPVSVSDWSCWSGPSSLNTLTPHNSHIGSTKNKQNNKLILGRKWAHLEQREALSSGFMGE